MNRWIEESRNQWIKKLTKQWINQTIKITHLLKTIIEYVLTWTSIWSRFQPYWWRIGLRTSSTSLVCLAFTPIDFLEGNSSLQYIYNYLLIFQTPAWSIQLSTISSKLQPGVYNYLLYLQTPAWSIQLSTVSSKLQPEVYNYLLYLPNSSLMYTIIYYIFQPSSTILYTSRPSPSLPSLPHPLPSLPRSFPVPFSIPVLVSFPPFPSSWVYKHPGKSG